jgi:hypothetical protein
MVCSLNSPITGLNTFTRITVCYIHPPGFNVFVTAYIAGFSVGLAADLLPEQDFHL